MDHWFESSREHSYNSGEIMKHEAIYCTQCQVWTLKCSECGMGGGSAGHHDYCTKWEEEVALQKCLEKLLVNTNLEILLNHTLK